MSDRLVVAAVATAAIIVFVFCCRRRRRCAATKPVSLPQRRARSRAHLDYQKCALRVRSALTVAEQSARPRARALINKAIRFACCRLRKVAVNGVAYEEAGGSVTARAGARPLTRPHALSDTKWMRRSLTPPPHFRFASAASRAPARARQNVEAALRTRFELGAASERGYKARKQARAQAIERLRVQKEEQKKK